MEELDKRKSLIRIVDDDLDLLKSVKFTLEIEGWNVQTYSSAEEFLGNPNFETPGCIVLDIRMPGISGMEVQEEIEQYQKAIPVIFLTGHGDLNTAIHVFRHGAFDFLQKPVDPNLFVETIEKAVRKSQKEYEKRQAQSPWRLYQDLTERQKNVLALIEEGVEPSFQAARLGISERTLERHRQNTMKKLQLKSREDVIHFMEQVRKSSASS